MKLIYQLFFDYFCFGKKFLVYNMVSRNIKSKYDRSIIGLGWTLLSPMMLAVIYYIVFKKIMHVQMEHYLAFILSGVLPWAFFSQCVMEGMESIVGNAGLVTKIPLPLQVLPFVNALTNLITLSASIPILVVVSAFQGISLGWHTLLVFYFYIVLFLVAYGLALVLSIALVLFRDLRHVMTLLMQIWFFGTPVVYSFAMIPEKYRIVIHLNPVADAISGLHTIFTDGVMPGMKTLMISSGWAAIFTFIGIAFMRKRFLGILEKL
ncbi:MAG TPA: ABC transporter permease [bacterium]|nr:ABC transporter permease [bacterium]